MSDFFSQYEKIFSSLSDIEINMFYILKLKYSLAMFFKHLIISYVKLTRYEIIIFDF